MGILRSIGKFVGEFFFVLCLSILILMLTIVELTDYSNLKPMVAAVINQQITKQMDAQKLSLLHAQILSQCSNRETLEMPMGEWGNATLKCSDVKSTKPEDLSSLIASSMFEKIYYKKYDCEFIQCYKQSEFQEKAMLFASSTANQFFKKYLIYLWVGTALFGLILLVSSKGWEIPKNFGKSLIAVGIPFILIKVLKDKINLPAEASAVQPQIDQILNTLSNRYLIDLIIGILLVIIGYSGSYLAKRKEIKKK